jgi:hypothetical protein
MTVTARRLDLASDPWPTTYCKTLTCQAPIIPADTARGVKVFDSEPDPAGTYSFRDTTGERPFAALLSAKLRFGRKDLYAPHKCRRAGRP